MDFTGKYLREGKLQINTVRIVEFAARILHIKFGPKLTTFGHRSSSKKTQKPYFLSLFLSPLFSLHAVAVHCARTLHAARCSAFFFFPAYPNLSYFTLISDLGSIGPICPSPHMGWTQQFSPSSSYGGLYQARSSPTCFKLLLRQRLCQHI